MPPVQQITFYSDCKEESLKYIETIKKTDKICIL